MLSISSIESFVSTCFCTLSDSPVKADCPTYKSLASIILKSAGIMLPADKTTTSLKTT